MSFYAESQRLLPSLREGDKQNQGNGAPTTTTATDVSSLDFERIINKYSIHATVLSQRKGKESTCMIKKSDDDSNDKGAMTKTSRWILTALAGLLTGFTSILLVR